jgi:hypothetical protein
VAYGRSTADKGAKWMNARCSMLCRLTEHGRGKLNGTNKIDGVAGKAQEWLGDASGAVARAGVMAYAIRHVDGGSGARGRDRGGASPRGFQVGSGRRLRLLVRACLLAGTNGVG